MWAERRKPAMIHASRISEATLEHRHSNEQAAAPAPWIVADAHVHFYPCFDATTFLDAAWRNLSAHASGERFGALLLLTETSQDDWFGALASQVERGPIADGWRVVARPERESLVLQGPAGATLYVIAGRQIVTAEDLEVLAVGTCERPTDGAPLADVLHHVSDLGALAIVPWGFGKWLGARGALVDRHLRAIPQPSFFLGDNGGRPTVWRDPAHFERARERGLCILPGSDPLPLSSDAASVGATGFRVSAEFSPNSPLLSLRAALQDSADSVTSYRRGETLLRFFRNQVAMQVRKRLRFRRTAA